MANFNELWGADNPSDSTNANEIDDYENNLRTMLAERVQDMIYGFTSGEDTDAPGFKYLTMKQQTSDPTTLADQVSLYVKDSTGACVYARPESAGTAVKILDAACQVPAGAYAADSIDEDDIQLSNTGMLQGEVAATGSSADIIGLNASDVPVLADGAVLAEATETADGDRTIADLGYVKTGDTAMHDATGGYNNCDVNGTKTKVYTKYLTGNLDADASTSVAHGVTAANILAVNVILYNDQLSQYVISSGRMSESSGYAWTAYYDATNIIISNAGEYLQGNAYRIRIDYTV